MVETIREAIEKRRLLRFAYTGLRGPSGKREAEPFTLALGGTAWYLHAFCRLRGEFRLFRLSRMEGLEVLPQRFDPRARLPVPPVWGSSWGDQESFEIVLRFEPSYRQAALDAFTATELSQEEDGSVLVRFRWPASDSPLRFIMGFGPGLRILAPESLRQALAQAAEDMARRNSG
jgi:predicted DNA-binding transcriptional regulator YafY